jgi:sodium/proline symporter
MAVGGEFNAELSGAFKDGVTAFGSNPFKASFGEIVSGLGWGLGYFGMPHILVRFMAIKDAKMVKKSAIVACSWVVLSLGAAIAIAILGRTFLLSDGVALADKLLPGNQQNIFIEIVVDTFPSFITGILLAAIIAASMSTADSQLLVASSAFTSDLYQPLFRKNKAGEKETLWVGRIVVAAVTVIAFAIAASGVGKADSWASNIMAMVENAWGLFGAAFGPVVVLSLFWRRFNYAGALAGILAGAVVDLVWLFTLTGVTGVYEIVPGAIAGAIAAVIATLATKAPSDEVLAIYDAATSVETEEA